MPGFDGTGPRGLGPLTGRGAGPCGGGYGRGYGRGAGRGLFRGIGRGIRGFFGQRYFPSRQEEIETLKDEAAFLQSSLDEIKGQMDALKKEGKKE